MSFTALFVLFNLNKSTFLKKFNLVSNLNNVIIEFKDDDNYYFVDYEEIGLGLFVLDEAFLNEVWDFYC